MPAPTSPTPTTEASRIRALVLRQYRAWSSTEPAGDRAHELRCLLWDIDHPADTDQTDTTWAAWIAEIEPRWQSGQFLHPEWVAALSTHTQHTA